MLQIEVDLYSGRPNPRFEVEEARASGILAGAEPGRDLIPVEQTSSTLGYRGLILRSRGEPLMEKAAGSRARLATTTFGDAAISRELALRLIDAAEPVRDREGPEMLLEAAEVREQKRFLMEQIAGEVPSTFLPLTEKMGQGLFQAPHVLIPCESETLRYDPTFWNDPLHVRRNNCYAFATNRRTDTFPQPGRASGSILRSLDCYEVGRASLADGLRWDGNCFGDEEQPRLYVALVIWPGQDYHWYRLQEGGNWAHKPGGTPATDLDSSGARIADPRTCDRGPYSQFCGYMLSPKSVRVA